MHYTFIDYLLREEALSFFILGLNLPLLFIIIVGGIYLLYVVLQYVLLVQLPE